MSVRLALFAVGGLALAVVLFFALGGAPQAAPPAMPTASVPAPKPSTGAGERTDAADATGEQSAAWAGHCDTLFGADVSEDCLVALDVRFLDSEPYQLPGLAMQAALVEVPDAPTWRELFTDPVATRERALEALSREECAREEGGISPELAEACGAAAIAHFAALKALCAKGPRLKFHLRRGLPEVLAELPATFKGERLGDLEDSDLYWRRRGQIEESYRWRAWAVTKCDRLPETVLDGVFADTPDLDALSRQHDPRNLIHKINDPLSSLRWPDPDYEANVATRRRAAPPTPRGAPPDTEFAAWVEAYRPFDVLEMPGDHDRWETYSCDWSAEQRYEAHRLMGIAARLGNQWAMTQYRTQRLRDLQYHIDLWATHRVLSEVQYAKYLKSPQSRVEAANGALSHAEDLGVRVDRERLLWLVGAASAAEAAWEADTLARWARGEAWQSADRAHEDAGDQERAAGAADENSKRPPKPH